MQSTLLCKPRHGMSPAIPWGPHGRTMPKLGKLGINLSKAVMAWLASQQLLLLRHCRRLDRALGNRDIIIHNAHWAQGLARPDNCHLATICHVNWAI